MSKMTEEQKQRGQMIDYLAKQRGISRDELVAMLQRSPQLSECRRGD